MRTQITIREDRPHEVDHTENVFIPMSNGCWLAGRGDSDRVLLDEYLDQELADGEGVLRWIASQPWSEGRARRRSR